MAAFGQLLLWHEDEKVALPCPGDAGPPDCELAGLPEDYASPHGLRAGFLTQAALDGAPLVAAVKFSLHRSAVQAQNTIPMPRSQKTRLPTFSVNGTADIRSFSGDM